VSTLDFSPLNQHKARLLHVISWDLMVIALQYLLYILENFQEIFTPSQSPPPLVGAGGLARRGGAFFGKKSP
jgi:hypothetical protein